MLLEPVLANTLVKRRLSIAMIITTCHQAVTPSSFITANKTVIQKFAFKMNASNYPPLNVLCAVKSRETDKLRYKITPYRFMKQNGEAFRIKQIRHFHQSREGKGEHYHYIVDVGDHRYCRILFDTNTFTWRLIQDIKMGEAAPFK